jgi:hypothetical protein
VSLFDDFLKDTVNLNQTRVDLLEDSIEALKALIRGSDWKPHVRGFEEPGVLGSSHDHPSRRR